MKRIRISPEHNFYDQPGKKLRPFTDAPDRDEWNTAIETCAAHAESRYPDGVNDKLAADLRGFKRCPVKAES